MADRTGVSGGPAYPVYIMGGAGISVVGDTKVTLDGEEVIIDSTRVIKTATIASGGSLSGAVDCGDNVVVGIVMPATWTTATLSFQGSHDNVTYQELKDKFDTLLSYNPLVACNRAVDLTDFLAWRYIKVRSGTAASAVNQAGDRVISVITRPV